MRRWDRQRVRSVAGEVAVRVAWVLVLVVFGLGLAWSASLQDERGPIAKAAADVLTVVLATLAVAEVVILVSVAIIGYQMFLWVCRTGSSSGCCS